MTELTQEYVKECFEYVDGKLFWKHRPLSHFNSEASMKKFNTPYAGTEAGYFNLRTDSKREGFGYYVVRCANKLRKVHRLIFLMHHGYCPRVVDHINNDSSDNRIENLRSSSVKKNAANSTTNYNKKTKGVYFSKASSRANPYRASIEVEGKALHLGHFPSEEEAQAAYNLVGIYLYQEHFREVPTCFEGEIRDTKFFKTHKIPRYYRFNKAP